MPPAPFDGAVRSIWRTYDTVGRLKKVESRSGPDASSSLVNDVEFQLDKYGLVTTFRQNPLQVQSQFNRTMTFAYDYPSSQPGVLRLASTTYPSGLQVTESYGASGSDSDKLSRVEGRVAVGGPTLFTNKYEGLGRVMTRSHPQPQVDRTVSLDRFSRIKTLEAIYVPYSYRHNNYDYGYNFNSQVAYRKELTTSGQSEEYLYNGLSMLKSHKRGVHDALGAIPAPTYQQNWNEPPASTQGLDHSGNWLKYKILPQQTGDYTRSFNASNELLTLNPPGGTPTTFGYDTNGNTTSATTGSSTNSFIYDAWNRLKRVTLSSGYSIDFTYNGLNHKVTKVESISGGGQNGKVYYYNPSWQVIQEYDIQPSYNPLFSYVWGTQYIDELVARRTEFGSSWEYFIQDANSNVVTRINYYGSVTHRYVYSAYGVPTQLNSSWTTITSITEDLHLFTGQEYHQLVGLYDYRNRAYHPTWGRFMHRDPIGIWGDGGNGGNGYAYTGGNPIGGLDPYGLRLKCKEVGGGKSKCSSTMTCEEFDEYVKKAKGPLAKLGVAVRRSTGEDASESDKDRLKCWQNMMRAMYKDDSTIDVSICNCKGYGSEEPCNRCDQNPEWAAAATLKRGVQEGHHADIQLCCKGIEILNARVGTENFLKEFSRILIHELSHAVCDTDHVSQDWRNSDPRNPELLDAVVSRRHGDSYSYMFDIEYGFASGKSPSLATWRANVAR